MIRLQNLIGKLLEPKRVLGQRRTGRVAPVEPAPGALAQVAILCHEPVWFDRGLAGRAFIDERHPVQGAPRVPGQPPGSSEVGGSILSEAQGATLLPTVTHSISGAQSQQPGPRAFIRQRVAADSLANTTQGGLLELG